MSFWKKPSTGPKPQKPVEKAAKATPAPIRQRDCSEDPKPHFRFYPDAYVDKQLVESDERCSLCACRCGWRYVGSIYTVEEPEIVCARCLADGTLRTALDEFFSTVDGGPAGDVPVDNDLLDEIMQRTPGIVTFNPFDWPVIDRQPLVYLGHADQRALADAPEAREAMTALAEELSWPEIGPHHAMIFRTLDGQQWRASLDLS